MNKRIKKKIYKRAEKKLEKEWQKIEWQTRKDCSYLELARRTNILTGTEKSVFIKRQNKMILLVDEILAELDEMEE